MTRPDLVAAYDKVAHKVILTWNDKNGEYNQSMDIQCKKAGTSIGYRNDCGATGGGCKLILKLSDG